MGLQVRMPEVVAALWNKTAMALIFVWGWVAGPASGAKIFTRIALAMWMFPSALGSLVFVQENRRTV